MPSSSTTPPPAAAASSAASKTNGVNTEKGKRKDTVVVPAAASNEPPPLTLARPFRSRKNRPCDGCRRAKTRCAITETGQPCVECQQTRKKCTFEEQPRERKKPAAKRPSAALESHTEDQTIDSYQRRPSTSNSAAPEHPVAKRLKTEGSGRKDSSLELSIADTAGLRYHVITSVLTDDLLPMGRVEGGQGEYIQQISMDSTKPQYLIFTRRNTSNTPPIVLDPLTDVRLALSILSPPAPEERSLLDLYLSTSNAAFPILPPYEEWLSNPSLYSKTLVAALNHCPGGVYRPHVRSTRKIAARNGPITNRSHDIDDRETVARDSSLKVITDALFDLSARPSPNAEENYLLLARTVAEAQLLGLHVDSSTWAIPEWEKDYRTMLWWSLRIHDSWSSFLNARPSHIQSNNHTVPLPSVTSVLSMAQVKSSAHAPPKAHSFLFLCQLAILVSRLQTQVCTLMTPKEERLGRVVEIDKEVAALLKEVTHYNSKSSTIPGFVSLMVCLMGFRCMVRRIIIELSIGLGAPFTPDPDTLELYAHAVDYVSTLDGPAFDGFWLIHCGHILSSMMSSLIRLSLATTSAVSTANSPGSGASSPPMLNGSQSQRYPNHQPNAYLRVDSQTNPIFLLCRLRRVLQKAKDLHHWDIGDAALARADRVAACLKPGGEEFENVVQALQGEFVPHQISLPMSTSSSPAPALYPLQPAPIPASNPVMDPQMQQQQHLYQQQQQQRRYQHMEDVRVHPQQPLPHGNTNWNIDLNVFGGMGLDPWVNQGANGGFPGVGMWGDSPATDNYYSAVNGHRGS